VEGKQGFRIARGDVFSLAQGIDQRADDQERTGDPEIAADPDQIQAMQQIVTRQGGRCQQNEQESEGQNMSPPER